MGLSEKEKKKQADAKRRMKMRWVVRYGRFMVFLYACVIMAVGVIIGYFVEPIIFAPSAPAVSKPKKEEPAKPAEDTEPEEPQEPEPPADDTPEPDEPEVEDDEDDTPEPEEPEDDETIDVDKARRLLEEDAGQGPAQEQKFTGTTISRHAWHDPRKVKVTLEAKLRHKLGLAGRNNIPKFLEDPETRLMLAQYEVLRLADMDALCELFRDRQVAESLEPLLNDLRWMTALAYDGELKNPEVVLEMIYYFRQLDPNMDKEELVEGEGRPTGVKRRIAAAVAAEFSRHGWYGAAKTQNDKKLDKRQKKMAQLMGEDNVRTMSDDDKRQRRTKRSTSKDNQREERFQLARERYMYFARSWDDDQLNAIFPQLPDWLMRFTCGWATSAFGTATTMTWLRDNTSAPLEEHLQMHGQVPYLPTNKYGDDIHSGWYYQPYDVLYPGNFAKEVRDVGGVCVQLSPFGAGSACSNGIPAMCMSEPGHCSWTMWDGKKWQPCNSHSENRMVSNLPWDLESFSDLELMAVIFQEQGKRTRDAQMVCTLAAMMAEKKSTLNSRRFYELAASMQPLYTPLWSSYLETVAPMLARQPKKYLEVNEFFCSNLAPRNPALCAKYLTEHIYPPMLKALRHPKKKLQAFLSYINHWDKNEGRDWNISEVLDMQYEGVGKLVWMRTGLLEAIGESVQKHREFVPALGWAVRKAMMENKLLGNKMLRIVDAMLEDLSPQNEEQAAVRRALHAAVIRGVEDIAALALTKNGVKGLSRKDCMELFNKYSRDYVQPDAQGDLPAFTPPPGNLISPGGLVTLSEYRADQSSLVEHAAALTLQGGNIISEKGGGQVLTIELPKLSTIGGIVIVVNGSCSQYIDAFIETSTDGKKWSLWQRLPNDYPGSVMVLEVKSHAPRAKFVRINSGGGIFMPGINFKAVLIYDNKSSK